MTDLLIDMSMTADRSESPSPYSFWRSDPAETDTRFLPVQWPQQCHIRLQNMDRCVGSSIRTSLIQSHSCDGHRCQQYDQRDQRLICQLTGACGRSAPQQT
jgi:hypothetical protein